MELQDVRAICDVNASSKRGRQGEGFFACVVELEPWVVRWSSHFTALNTYTVMYMCVCIYIYIYVCIYIYIYTCIYIYTYIYIYVQYIYIYTYSQQYIVAVAWQRIMASRRTSGIG